MLVRFALVFALLAAPAGAAPLCRDLKGLYTPCPPGQGAPARSRAAKPAKDRPVAPATAEVAATPAPAAPGRALIAHSRKLCRDTKGLYTPCPR